MEYQQLWQKSKHGKPPTMVTGYPWKSNKHGNRVTIETQQNVPNKA
jgi:hypothetical protein